MGVDVEPLALLIVRSQPPSVERRVAGQRAISTGRVHGLEGLKPGKQDAEQTRHTMHAQHIEAVVEMRTMLKYRARLQSTAATNPVSSRSRAVLISTKPLLALWSAGSAAKRSQ
jgi:hypothetical protein